MLQKLMAQKLLAQKLLAQKRVLVGIIAGMIILLVIAALSFSRTRQTETLAHEAKAKPALAENQTMAITPPSLPEQTAAATSEAPVKHIEHPILQRFIAKDAANRLPTDFPELVPTVQSKDDIAAVLYVLLDASDLASIRNEAINLLRRSNVPHLETHLMAILDNPDEKERFRSFAVQHLGDMMVEYIESTEISGMAQSGKIRDRLVTALSDNHLSVRREAVLALTHIRDPKVTAIIRSGLQDPAWSEAHDLLIRCAYDANLSDLIPAIRPLAYDERTPVRIAALNALSQWKDIVSKPAFEEATRSTVVRIQRAGALAMQVIEAQP
jgi:hypothetical protein